MKTTIENNLESVLEYLKDLNDNDLVNIHNQYCQNANYSDDEIYINDEEFFEMFYPNKTMDAIRAIHFGDYNWNHEYVVFNGYGNLESFDNPSNHIDLDAIAEHILENSHEYDIELEEIEEENENED